MLNKEELRDKINLHIREYYDNHIEKGIKGVPVSGKKFDHTEIQAIVNAALDCWWTEGKVTETFEKKFSMYLGTKHTIVVNSGSSANLLAMKTLCSAKLGMRRLKPGDEVITTAAGFPTTINPIIQCGCTPVFLDIELPTYNPSLESIEKAISSKTRAIFLAHSLGNPFEAKEVAELCKEKGIWLIEDNCDSLGSRYKGQLTGTFGEMSTHSFYPAHHMTMGEGGALCTNDLQLARIARSIKGWGRDCWCYTGHDNSCGKRYDGQFGDLPEGYDHKYVYSEIGYNLKNTDLNVAIGVTQIEKLGRFVEMRKRNFKQMLQEMKKFEEYFIMPEATKGSEPSWFGFMLTLKENTSFSRRELLKHFEKNLIGTRLLFAGNVTRQPYFIENKIQYRISGSLKNTDLAMNKSFWLGVSQMIGPEEIKKVSESISEFLNER
jgi:CDP-6-deoxy-D-xylo-4-hexulose-3-dehydrase